MPQMTLNIPVCKFDQDLNGFIKIKPLDDFDCGYNHG